MKLDFNYKEKSGQLDYNIWTGKSKIFWEGKELEKKDKIFETPDGKKIKPVKDKIILPALEIDGEKVVLVELKTWEWIFVLLPVLYVFFGGAIPVALGLGGVFFNLGFFMDESKSNTTKIAASLGYLIVVFILLSIISAGLQAVL